MCTRTLADPQAPPSPHNPSYYEATETAREFVAAFREAEPYIEKVGTPLVVRFFTNLYADCGSWQFFTTSEAHDAGKVLTLSSCFKVLPSLCATDYIKTGEKYGTYRFTAAAFEAYLVLSATALEPLTRILPPHLVRTIRALQAAQRPMKLHEIAASAQLPLTRVRDVIGYKAAAGCFERDDELQYRFVEEAMSPKLRLLLKRYS